MPMHESIGLRILQSFLRVSAIMTYHYWLYWPTHGSCNEAPPPPASEPLHHPLWDSMLDHSRVNAMLHHSCSTHHGHPPLHQQLVPYKINAALSIHPLPVTPHRTLPPSAPTTPARPWTRPRPRQDSPACRRSCATTPGPLDSVPCASYPRRRRCRCT